MKVWMLYITVKERTAGAPRVTARWLDSQWAKKSAAKERQGEIEASMRHFECYCPLGSGTGASVDIVEASIADAAISDSGTYASQEPTE